MKALFYRTFRGPISIENLPDPSPGEGAVVIRVMASGLCLSDWHGWMGHDPDIRLPHIPGHELAGTIASVGKGVRNWKVGQRVTVPFVCGCGNCTYCTEGNQQVCNNQFQPGFTAWGSFAEYVEIKYAEGNLVELPADLDFVHAASLGCRFVTAYRAVAIQSGLKPGQWLAVHGCGGVGLSALLIGKALGARVIAVDISDEKCSLAQSLGADYSINAFKTPIVEAIREISKGGVHIGADAYGDSGTCLNSILSLRKGGRHLQLGLLPQKTVDIPMDKVIAHELQIIGSHGMQAHVYPEMFNLIRHRGINLGALVCEQISLEKAGTLIPLMDRDPVAGIRVITSI